MLPIGILGAVQFLPAQPRVAKVALEAAEVEAEEDTTIELTVAERRAQRREAREAREEKTKAAVAEPEMTVEVINPGFNGFETQNVDFGTMQTPFAGGFGMMPMPFGGFPAFGAMPTTDANGFNGFGATPDAAENTFNGFGADFGNF